MPRKNLQSFLRDWGYPDRAQEPELLNAVLPVVMVDDAAEFLCRDRPMYMGRSGLGATAAVYSVVGLVAGNWPIKIFRVVPYAITAGTALWLIWTERGVDLRTANQATGSSVTSLLRGQVRQSSLYAGTTTVNETGWTLYDVQGTAEVERLPEWRDNPLCLRPGEGLWVVGGAVNVNVNAEWSWEELAITPANVPPDVS